MPNVHIGNQYRIDCLIELSTRLVILPGLIGFFTLSEMRFSNSDCLRGACLRMIAA